MKTLKQSTAYNLMVLMIDSTDHIAGKAGLTLTITASKNGAAFAGITPTVTDRGSGWYNLELTDSHTDTLGDLAIHVTATGADPFDISMQVYARVFDDLSLASALQTVDDLVDDLETRLTATRAGYLDRLDAAISSRMATFTYTAPDNVSITAIKAKTDNLPASPADQSALEVLLAALPPAPSANDIIAALKVAVFDGTLTFEDSIKLYNAILFGKLDGGGTGTLKFRDPADTVDRVVATVDLVTADRDHIILDLT